MPKLDVYTIHARVAPVILTVLPAIALALALIPALPGAQRLWGTASFPVIVFAALTARTRGNAVQTTLWEEWGGAPTTRRLRFRGAESLEEVRRHHQDVEVTVGNLSLPTEEDEGKNPTAADAEYAAATRRLIGCVRQEKKRFPLVDTENRNYGYARNLLGLRPIGQWCSIACLLLSTVLWIAVAAQRSAAHASAFLVPAVTSIAMLLAWQMVKPDWVRIHAEAYADRLLEAAQILARPTPPTEH